jgi:hypothetical protein
MTTLYVLDVEDFRPLVQVAATLPGVQVHKRGPYYEVTGDRSFEIPRAGTGCRNAVWYSSIAAIRDGRVSRWDKKSICITPFAADAPAGPPAQVSKDDFTSKDRVDDLARDVT